jgi:hypothetical protein
MAELRPQIGDKVLGGRYELLREVKGSVGGGPVYLGKKGLCRFCGSSDPACFRKTAHTFPEALGNKWVFSRDECDDCNTKIFSLYDEELAKAVSPFLTLGGVKGKGNKVRSTGRTGRRSHIAHLHDAGRRRISMSVLDDDAMEAPTFDPETGNMRLTTPIAAVPFKPRYAYKALCKMALALMPDEELPNYRKLIAWLLDPQSLTQNSMLRQRLLRGVWIAVWRMR